MLHGDETTLQVLNEPGRTSVSKSYMWLYRTSGCVEYPIVLYEYQFSRKAEHVQAFLKDFSTISSSLALEWIPCVLGPYATLS